MFYRPLPEPGNPPETTRTEENFTPPNIDAPRTGEDGDHQSRFFLLFFISFNKSFAETSQLISLLVELRCAFFINFLVAGEIPTPILFLSVLTTLMTRTTGCPIDRTPFSGQ
jgi:hypothetical protein